MAEHAQTELPSSETQATYDTICEAFSTADGIALCNEERFFAFAEPEFLISPFVYGETVHASIEEFLLILKNEHGLFQSTNGGGCFFDLGSGLGKPCVTAALTLPDFLTECVGIEFLEGLQLKSLELAASYEASTWFSERKEQGKECPKLRFERDDFILHSEEWVSRSDVVFANATCFEPEMI